MPLRFGPGPVFIYESIAAARRRQMYALRALFVFGLLLALLLGSCLGSILGTASFDTSPIRALAELGENFYYAIATTQLVLVILIAPAATAGAICVDRARGTLTHMLVTDLADSEIVLGRLAARLAPVFALVAATVPVLVLAGLLGGIVPEAIVTLTLVTLGMAVVGCALAMAFSVRLAKVHEVLMAVYAIEAVWILGPLCWAGFAELANVVPEPPEWYLRINPFLLAWAPYAWPNMLTTGWCALVLGLTVSVSAGLVAYAAFRLRSDTARRRQRPASRVLAWFSQAGARLAARRHNALLDDDPVLWREWRRGRPSRVARIIWGVYIALAVCSTVLGIVLAYTLNGNDADFLAGANGLQATFGLLLVSLVAPTALAEERARGSLDVLMTTPLSTARIIWAKWRGAFRAVPALAFLPAVGSIVIASVVQPTGSPWSFAGHAPEPFGWIDRIAMAGLPTALFLAQGAAVTSFGLATAAWCTRLGRAVALSVATYTVVAFGWLVALYLGLTLNALGWFGLDGQLSYEAIVNFCSIVGGAFCPLGGQICNSELVSAAGRNDRMAVYIGETVVVFATLGVALLFLGLTLASFNRAMGRMPERRRRAPRPPAPRHGAIALPIHGPTGRQPAGGLAG